jgi:pyruvate formate lyase activating enzyme
LGPETPWHISRFFPAYEMQDTPPTPPATIRRARDIGYDEGLHHIYAGNLPDEQSTLCHECDAVLIRRSGYRILQRDVDAAGRCPACGTPVAGVGIGG